MYTLHNCNIVSQHVARLIVTIELYIRANPSKTQEVQMDPFVGVYFTCLCLDKMNKWRRNLAIRNALFFRLKKIHN